MRTETFANKIAINSDSNGGSRSLNIELDSKVARSLTLKITDIVGRILFEKHTGFMTEDNTALDISDYSLGMYFLKLENIQGKIQTERFVINN